MTDFVGEIHSVMQRAAKKRGRGSLSLGVRVPATLTECEVAGLDPKTWVEREWIDFLVVADWNLTWPDMPIERFAAFTAGTKCRLYAQMGDMMGGTWTGKPEVTGRGPAYAPGRRGYSGMLLTRREARAAALNHYTWGADGISFWNIACNEGRGKWGHIPGQHERVWGWMNEVIDIKRIRAGKRCYHFLPLYKRQEILPRNYAWNENLKVPTGAIRAQVITLSKLHQRGIFTFRMADGRDGEELKGILRFPLYHVAPDDLYDVDINGIVVDPSRIKRSHDQSDSDLPRVWLEVDLVDCPAFMGDNKLGITWRGRAGGAKAAPYMEELEVIVEP